MKEQQRRLQANGAARSLPTRRQAARWFLGFVAASPLADQSTAQTKELAGTHWPERLPPLEDVVNALEMEPIAEKSLAKPVYERIAGGAGSESTLRRNREYFNRVTLRPRVLVNVEGIDISTSLFGQELYSPLLVGPTARHERVHPLGELATAAGAKAAKTLMVISHRSSRPVGEILQEGGGDAWLQFDASDDDTLVRRAAAAVEQGCKAICLTVGAPAPVPLWRDIHNGLAKAVNSTSLGNESMTWPQIETLKKSLAVPLVVKGILSVGEARRAVDHGVDGIVVSNHGGRAMDGEPATIEVLPGIADALTGRIPILIDGGFRRGTDILKALALGADAVLLGRPILWALAAYGSEGVRKLLEILQHELALSMGLAGQAGIAGLGRSLVRIHSR